MKSLEKEMENIKIEVKELEPPMDLELRLRKRLELEFSMKSKKSRYSWVQKHRIAAVILLIAMLLGVLKYDVLAYYGRKILGYDEIIYGSMQALNEAGFGQEINKSYTFRNGTEVILDGAMLDDNKLIIMYRVRGTKENIMELSNRQLNGVFGRYYTKSGYGKYNEDFTEVKFIDEFEAPWIFDNYLKFSVLSHSSDEAKGEVGVIPFKLSYDKCMKRVLKLKLDKSIEYEGVQYTFNSLSATQMSTVLEGIAEAAGLKDNGMENRHLGALSSHLRIELVETYVKDGKTITKRISEGGRRSQGTSGDGKVRFTYEYEGISQNVQKLTLNILSLEEMKEFDESISLSYDAKHIKVLPESDELVINRVQLVNENTVISMTARKDAKPIMALFIGNKQAGLLGSDIKESKGKDSEMVEHIYRFEGGGTGMILMFKGIVYVTGVNKELVIYE